MPSWRPAVPAEFVDPARARADEGDTLPEAFAAVVAERGDHVAVDDADGTCTFGELDAQSRVVAGALASHPDLLGPVAVLASYGRGTLVALLGIARAGHAAIVLDPDGPDAARRNVVATVRADSVVVDASTRGAATALGSGITVLDLDHLLDAANTPGATTVEPSAPYLISSTSGSSGVPKAVVHSQRNVVANARRFAAMNAITADDTFHVSMPMHFVGGMTSVFGALLAGARARYLPVARHGVQALADDIARTGPSVIQVAPLQGDAVATALVAPVPSVRLVNLGGDRVGLDALARVRTAFPTAQVSHRYSTSETHMIAGLAIDPGAALPTDDVPAGWPVPWLELRIVGDDGEAVPDGDAGECWVGGDHLALGYLGDDARTADRFVERDGHRWYRTGDRVRRRADGCLEHLGRADLVVKVNGVLVDPVRVEQCLTGAAGIDDVAVVDYTDASGRTRLAAFVVGGPLGPGAVRRRVAASLPRAMVPQRVVQLETIPVTPRGKRDVDRLRTLAAEPTAPGAPPTGATETIVAGMFAELFHADDIGRDDDFFALGGDSLTTIELVDWIHEELGVELEITTLLEHSTVADLAAWLDAATPVARDLVRLASGPPDRVPVVLFPTGVLFHDVLGLARGLPEREVHMVVPHGLEPGQRPDRTIRQAAARALAALDQLDPSGRFVLVGRSAGGVHAFEVARELEARGCPPPLVVLIDTTGPHRERFRRPRHYFRRMAELPDGDRARQRLKQTGWAAWTEIDMWWLGMSARWTTRSGDQQVRTFQQLANRAIANYDWRPYAGNVLLLRAGDHRFEFSGEPPDRGWSKVCTGSFEMITVPGTHVTMGYPEHLATTLAPIIAALAGIDDEGSNGRT
jgi:acyl-CoA synthetase (AMP-forming)/AMP-acid ligase II/thioesterase domain-containing protein/acyl carrier protein